MKGKQSSLRLIIGSTGALAIIALVGLLVDYGQTVEAASQPTPLKRPQLALTSRRRRSPLVTEHHQMMHNHLSRKVMDRACAASKDTIDEIVACMTSNQALLSSIKKETASSCYKDSFGQEFNEKELDKHKELICNNRDKFEAMTTCIYKKTSEQLDPKQMEKLTETLVDIGLCIINALDG